jgi:hypothetical protein
VLQIWFSNANPLLGLKKNENKLSGQIMQRFSTLLMYNQIALAVCALAIASRKTIRVQIPPGCFCV